MRQDSSCLRCALSQDTEAYAFRYIPTDACDGGRTVGRRAADLIPPPGRHTFLVRNRCGLLQKNRVSARGIGSCSKDYCSFLNEARRFSNNRRCQECLHDSRRGPAFVLQKKRMRLGNFLTHIRVLTAWASPLDKKS